jgi:hypothetical protein
MRVQNFGGMGWMVQGAVARESGRAPDRPRIVPRDLPPPQITDELTLKEMMEQSPYFQILEEYFRNNPPPSPRPRPGAYDNPYLTPDHLRNRVDENAPIKNPWGN